MASRARGSYRPLPASSASGAKSKKATPITAPAEKPNTSGNLPASFKDKSPPVMVAVQAPAAISITIRAVMEGSEKAAPCLSRRVFGDNPGRGNVGQFGMGLVHRDHVHPHFHHMVMAAQDDARHRRHIAIIAAPGGGDMAFAHQEIVGGVQIHPAERRCPDGKPGMTGIGA